MFKYKFNQKDALAKWGPSIEKVTGLSSNINEAKLETIATMCQLTENLDVQKNVIGRAGHNMQIVESYGSSVPQDLGNGMGAVQFPDNPNGNIGQGMAPNYKKGSDFAAAKLGIMMHTAAHTVALDLVPVIPIDMPNVIYGFLDIVYAGGRVDSVENTPDYIEIFGGKIGTTDFDLTVFTKSGFIFLTGEDGGNVKAGLAIQGRYIGTSRINSRPIIKVEKIGTIDAAGAFTVATTNSVADVLAGHTAHMLVAGTDATTATVATKALLTGAASATLVSALNNHIPGAVVADGVSETADSREVAELGHTKKLGARFYTKSVSPKDITIEGEATRHQVRDLGAYGIDVYAQLFKAAQNELTQFINKDIATSLFRLGVTNAAKLRVAQNVDLNMFLANGSTASKDLANFKFLNSASGEFKDIQGVDQSALFTAVKNNETNSSAENKATRDRRIQSRLMASSSIIGNVSRNGIGDFAIVNEQMKSVIRDGVMRPDSMPNTIKASTKSLYFVGRLNDLDIYCDPNMKWDDTRVLVGRKGENDDSGLKFMPYDLVSSVDTIAEGTMSFKFLVSSSYALLPAGFAPEVNYLTIAFDTDFGSFV